MAYKKAIRLGETGGALVCRAKKEIEPNNSLVGQKCRRGRRALCGWKFLGKSRRLGQRRGTRVLILGILPGRFSLYKPTTNANYCAPRFSLWAHAHHNASSRFCHSLLHFHSPIRKRNSHETSLACTFMACHIRPELSWHKSPTSLIGQPPQPASHTAIDWPCFLVF